MFIKKILWKVYMDCVGQLCRLCHVILYSILLTTILKFKILITLITTYCTVTTPAFCPYSALACLTFKNRASYI